MRALRPETPEPVVQVWVTVLADVVKDPEFCAAMDRLDRDCAYGPPELYSDLLAQAREALVDPELLTLFSALMGEG